jgi:DNA polymerase III subunit delta
MARISPPEMMDRLAKGKIVPAIVLLGDEPYLRDELRTRLIDQYVPAAARAWALSRYSAGRDETEAAIAQAQSLPMLTAQQIVFLEDAALIEKFGEKNRDETVQLLEAYLTDPAPFTVFVIEAARLDERMKLAKVLGQNAVVVDVGLGENPEQRLASAATVAGTLVKEYGLGFENGAAEDLAECVAADLMRLKTEIAKLADYLGDRKTIRREDVRAMVISERTATVWDLADLLASRQGSKALEFLERLLRDGEEPVAMLGAMTWMYRKLIEASEVRGAMNGWQAARSLGMRPEQAELALRAARKASKPQLLSGLLALEKADSRLKSGKDSRTVMEFLIVELTGSGKALAQKR